MKDSVREKQKNEIRSFKTTKRKDVDIKTVVRTV